MDYMRIVSNKQLIVGSYVRRHLCSTAVTLTPPRMKPCVVRFVSVDDTALTLALTLTLTLVLFWVLLAI